MPLRLKYITNALLAAIYAIWAQGDNMFKVINNRFILAYENRVWVYNARLANELNRVLKAYDHSFKSTVKEEPLFRFSEAQKAEVYKILGVAI